MHPDALAARLPCILLGYLFGSFLTAEVVSRVVSGKSARQLGTGNPGMANIMAQLGKGVSSPGLFAPIFPCSPLQETATMLSHPTACQGTLQPAHGICPDGGVFCVKFS